MIPPRRGAYTTRYTSEWWDIAVFVGLSDVESACPWWAGSWDTTACKENGTMRKLHRLVGFVVICGWVSWTGTVHADAVTDWHAIAVQASATTAPARLRPVEFLDLA